MPSPSQLQSKVSESFKWSPSSSLLLRCDVIHRRWICGFSLARKPVWFLPLYWLEFVVVTAVVNLDFGGCFPLRLFCSILNCRVCKKKRASLLVIRHQLYIDYGVSVTDLCRFSYLVLNTGHFLGSCLGMTVFWGLTGRPTKLFELNDFYLHYASKYQIVPMFLA